MSYTSETEDSWDGPEEDSSEIEDFCDDSERVTSEIEDFCDDLERVTSEIEYFCDDSERVTSEIEDFCDDSERVTSGIEDFCDDSERVTSGIESFCESYKMTENDTANVILTKMWEEMEKNERESRKKVPKVIAVQKKKIFMALNEIPDETLSNEDLQVINSFKPNAFFLLGIARLFKPQSLVWDDSEAKAKLAEIMKKHAKFELSKYLECAKIVFLAYSGREQNAVNAMEYVLTHARQFGDTTKTIFQIDESDNLQEAAEYDREQLVLQTLPTNKLLDKISQITQDLTTTYDETKYTILNVNATYFTLLMLRRIVKNETEFVNAFKKIQTHDNYVKLCPSPLHNQLPKCEFKIFEKSLVNCAYLAVEAYLNTADEKTKRILRATSLLYMEWNGLQLPELFFKVVKLYKVTAGELYDSLFLCDSDYPVLKTCFNFADDYYNIHEKLKTGVTNRWFPYCRVLDGAYHVNLSAKYNVEICVILAYLVDLKMGFDRSTLRMSHWAKSHITQESMEKAKMLYEKFNKNV